MDLELQQRAAGVQQADDCHVLLRLWPQDAARRIIQHPRPRPSVACCAHKADLMCDPIGGSCSSMPI